MKRVLVGLVVAFCCAVAWPCIADEMDADDTGAPASGGAPGVSADPGAGRWLRDVWTRDKLTGDWGGLRGGIAAAGTDTATVAYLRAKVVF